MKQQSGLPVDVETRSGGNNRGHIVTIGNMSTISEGSVIDG